MALRSALGLWAYSQPGTTAYPLIVQEYGEWVGALEFTTVAPGGFGDLACVVKLPDARIPRPELALFSRVCLKDGVFTCFAGEWSDPAIVLDERAGEHVLLSALGGGIALRDDPDESTYTSQTVQQIISAEFSKRSAYLAIDPDLSQVFPTNPVTTFSPAYDGYHLEEILHDLCFDLGDFTWEVWDHPQNRDGAGFPTWQLQAHARDTATTGYMALADDIVTWRVAPSAQRAYNAVEVCYVDVTGGPGKVLATDTRLSGSGGQNLAPFRRRKLRRSLGHIPLTTGQATTIANAWLGAYQNATNKVEVELRGIRDGNGVPIPLHQARADRNLWVPELGVRGTGPFGTGPLPALSGGAGPAASTNQFYVVETVYRETASGDMRLVLHLDNDIDRGGFILAQLKLAYDAASRSRGKFRHVASPGAPEVGSAGATFSNVSAGGTVAVRVNFKTVLAKAPSSITLTATGQSNTSGVTFANADLYGFTLTWTAPASGATSWIGTYETVGN
jgi:hypothetical protein